MAAGVVEVVDEVGVGGVVVEVGVDVGVEVGVGVEDGEVVVDGGEDLKVLSLFINYFTIIVDVQKVHNGGWSLSLSQ